MALRVASLTAWTFGVDTIAAAASLLDDPAFDAAAFVVAFAAAGVEIAAAFVVAFVVAFVSGFAFTFAADFDAALSSILLVRTGVRAEISRAIDAADFFAFVVAGLVAEAVGAMALRFGVREEESCGIDLEDSEMTSLTQIIYANYLLHKHLCAIAVS
jgi:hypothetical protein